ELSYPQATPLLRERVVFQEVGQRTTSASRSIVVHSCWRLYVDRLTPSRKLFCITCLSLIRALASRAFTVPVGTPRNCAVSRMLKPSTSRNRKVVRRGGESRKVA